MADENNPTPDQNEIFKIFVDVLAEPKLRELIAELKPQYLEFLLNFFNRQSAGFLDRGKSAELVGYAGEPGSNQLAVQGHRILNHPKVQKCIAAIFEQAGCTLELDAKVISEAMTATRTRYLRGPDNTIISTSPEPDHPTQLRAVDVKHRLLRTGSATLAHHRLAAESGAASSAQYGLCAICGEALSKVAGLSPADRALLRDITKSDRELRSAENSQEKDGDKDGLSDEHGHDS